MSNVIPIRDDYLIVTGDDHAERKRREAIITAAQNWHTKWKLDMPEKAASELRAILTGEHA